METAATFPPFYRRLREGVRSRWALLVLAAASVSEAIISPLPPDVLLAPMTIASPARAWRLAGLTTLFSVAGGIVGYLIGVFFMDYFGWALLDLYGLREQFARFEGLYQNYGIAVVLVGAFTPIPYKVIAITSGAASLNPFVFIFFSLLGRGGRFFIVAGLCRVWGPAAEEFLLRLAFGTKLKQALFLILAGVLIVLLGVFYFEYVLGLAPCELCLWQRWPYYAVAALCFAALFLPLERLRWSVLVLCFLIFIASAILGGYHAGVEWAWWPGPAQCAVAADIAESTQGLMTQLATAEPLRCDEAPWRLWGVSLAGYNFLISLAFAGFTLFTLFTGWTIGNFDESRKEN